VVTALPAASRVGVVQAVTGWPSIWTMQAPQPPCPQPNFVPLSPKRADCPEQGLVGLGFVELDRGPVEREANRFRHLETLPKSHNSRFLASCSASNRQTQQNSKHYCHGQRIEQSGIQHARLLGQRFWSEARLI
jgi:hypothetical protein